MKKTIGILVVLVLLAGMLVGCSQTPADTSSSASDSSAVSESAAAETQAASEGKVLKIGYTTKSQDDYFTTYVAGLFADMVAQDPSFELTLTDGANDINTQLDQIDLFLAKEVDIIIAVPVDDKGILSGIDKANAAGIPFISFIADAAEGGERIQIGVDQYEAGKLQAEYIKDLLPENAQIVYLIGMPGMSAASKRQEGFKETIGELRPDVTLLAEQTGNWNRDEGMAIMEDWIQAFDQIDGVVSANDQMALGAIQALQAADRLDGVVVTGVDGTYDACEAIANGEMTMSCYQDGLGEATALYDTVKAIAAGETVEPVQNIPFVAIGTDNVQEFLDMYAAQE